MKIYQTIFTAILLFLLQISSANAKSPIKDVIDFLGSSNRVPKSKIIFKIPKTIKEVSGIVYERRRNLLYSITDSGKGNRTVLGVTDMRSLKTIVINISGATNKDWEALVMDEVGDLWVIDSGNNKKKRNSVTFYRLRVTDDALRNRTITPRQTVTAVYEKGMMDVEGALIRNGRLFLFEKNVIGRARVSYVDLDPTTPRKVTAKHYTYIANTKMITDVAADRNGKIYLLTYTGIYHLPVLKKSFIPVVPRKELSFFDGQVEAFVVAEDIFFKNRRRSKFLIGHEEGQVYVRP